MINIVYAGNDKVFKGMLLSAMSIIKSCEQPLNIFILTMDIESRGNKYQQVSDKQILLLEGILQDKNPDSKVKKVNLSEMFKTHFSNSPNKNTEYTPFALLRLFLDIMPEVKDIDKTIYLDVDTMVTADISQLYDIDLASNEFGVVLDYMGKFWIAKDYFNSGIMLLNLKEIRETGLMIKSRDLVNKKWLKLPDQSALYRMSIRRMYLPYRFNEQREIKSDTVVKHFCKGIKWLPFFHLYNIKQWDITNVHKKLKIHDFDDIYSEYITLQNQHDFI